MMKLLPRIFSPKDDDQRRAEILTELIHHEAKIGGKLFGQIPAGHRREFFCLDEHTWIWHEEWIDQAGNRQVITTRYDFRPNGVLKSQGNNTYQLLTPAEAINLYDAINLYKQRVDGYHRQLLHAA